MGSDSGPRRMLGSRNGPLPLVSKCPGLLLWGQRAMGAHDWEDGVRAGPTGGRGIMPGTAEDLISAPAASTVQWRGNSVPRLVAGTAQLGMRYGIANRAGPPSQSRATEVIEAALDCRIRFFDTAQAYGTSEAFLGDALRQLGATKRCAKPSGILGRASIAGTTSTSRMTRKE